MIPNNIDRHVRELFTLWRESAEYDGSTFIPRAEFYVEGEMQAIVMFPPDDSHPMANALFEVAATLSPLGDGIVVVCEAWVKEGTRSEVEQETYHHGDLAKDASTGQGLVIMQITGDTIECGVIPFGVTDHGEVDWGETMDMPEFDGRMVDIVHQAWERGRSLHDHLRSVIAQMEQVALEFGGEPLGNGSLYRGALNALAEGGRYLVAITPTLMEMP